VTCFFSHRPTGRSLRKEAPMLVKTTVKAGVGPFADTLG